MIKRTLMFSNPAYLSHANRQLIIDLPGEDKKRTVPIEDIGVVVLENQQITISHGCIAALLQNNVAVISCDSTYMPTGLILPLDGDKHNPNAFAIKKFIIRQSIEDYGSQVDICITGRNRFVYGDPIDYEARAAAYYWQTISFREFFGFYHRIAQEHPH
ncbi:hypothetical protein FQR65_LT15912 [Abscondita terminalis]|nr:hypothetical protein FQR65_LT15912 [Abscondita terminalis]